MRKDIAIRMLHSVLSKLVGKTSAYDKYRDKADFIIDMKMGLEEASELIKEIEKGD